MNVTKLILSATACLAVAGCEKIAEFLPSHREKRAIENAVEAVSRSEVDTSAESLDSVALQTFRHHVESTSKILAGELSAAVRRVDEIKADSDALAKAMSKAATARRAEDGGPIAKKDALLSLLRNDSVNALARRYLRREFSMVALDAEERITAAEAEERNRIRELEANAAEARATVAEAQAEDRRARAAILQSERKLKRDLESLKRRKNKLENELNMTAASERARKRQEIKYIDDDIRRIEREYDGLRTSRSVNMEMHRLGENVRKVQAASDTRRNTADREASRAGELTSPAEVAAQFERDTVVALEKAIWDALASAEARKTRISRAADYVKATGDVRSSLAPSALQSLRTEIDTRVSAALEEPK